MGLHPADDICAFIRRAVCCWWIHDFGPVMLRLGVLGRVPWWTYCTVCFRCSVENPHCLKIWLWQFSMENPHWMFVVLVEWGNSSLTSDRYFVFSLVWNIHTDWVFTAAVQFSKENPHWLVGCVVFIKNLLCSLVVFYVQQSFTAFSLIFFSQVLASWYPGWMPSTYNQKLFVFALGIFPFSCLSQFLSFLQGRYWRLASVFGWFH